MTFLEFVVMVSGAAIGFGASTFGGYLFRRRTAALFAEEPTCVGYAATTSAGDTWYGDCEALRSPTCVDGRCSYHCGRMCKCDRRA